MGVDRPVVLEAFTDPEVPTMLPSRVGAEQEEEL